MWQALEAVQRGALLCAVDPLKAEDLRVVGAGLWRFFDEGYAAWPMDSFFKILGSTLSADDPDLVAQLEHWEAQGLIRVKWTEDPFITVLRAP